MLGMMNAPSDNFEFYATNRKVSGEVGEESNNSDLKTFTEVKQKDVITYTEDGRKMVNGKLAVASDVPKLWGDALLRGRIRTITPTTERRSKKEKAKGKRGSKKLDKTIAVVASLQKMSSQDDGIVGQTDTPSSSSSPPIEITTVPVVGSSVPVPSTEK